MFRIVGITRVDGFSYSKRDDSHICLLLWRQAICNLLADEEDQTC
jgi:hypothetical protein